MIRKTLLTAIGFCLFLQASHAAISTAFSSGCAGPEGGRILSLVIDSQDPAVVYAGTYAGGLYKSADGGADWSKADHGITGRSIDALAIDPENPRRIFAASDRGLFRSTDGGARWDPIENDELVSSWISSLVIDPQDPAILYAAGPFDGVFKSTDGGRNWTSVNDGLPDNTARVLAINPQSPTTLYAAGMGVFKSIDGGATWSPVNDGISGLVVQAIAIDPQSPDSLYIGASTGGVFKTTDGGASWNSANSGLANMNVQALALDPTHPATVYAGTFLGGIYKSSDGGATWQHGDTGISGESIHAVAIDPQNTANVFAGAVSGVFKSTDGGKDWTLVNKGLVATIINSLAIDPRNPAVMYAAAETGVYKTTSRCAGWTAIGLSDKGIISLTIDRQNPSILYAVGSSGIFKSVNDGENWSAIGTGLPDAAVSVLTIDPQTPNTLYAGTIGEGIFKSTDGGSTWKSANVGFDDGLVQALVIDPHSPATVFAGTLSGVYRSTNGGMTWEPADSGLPDTWVNALAIDPQNPATLYAVTSQGIYKSANGGTGWDPAGLRFYPIRVLTIDPQRPATLYASTQTGELFRTADGARTWIKSKLEFGDQWVTAIATDPVTPQSIYAGTFGAGVRMIDVSVCSFIYLVPIPPGGAAACHTSGTGEAMRTGYATLILDAGTAPSGIAVFSFRQNGVTVSEAGVPASPATTRARLFVDFRADVNAIPGQSSTGTVDINTGIAIVNNGAATANVTYVLRAFDGGILAAGHGTIAAGGHFAKFVDQLKEVAPDFDLPSDFKSAVQFGSLEISSDQPLSVLGLRGTINQRNEFIMTTIPVADLGKSIPDDPIYFPQLADGGGYTTSLLLLNTANRVERGTLQILDNHGTPMTVNQVGGSAGSSFRYSIPPGGAFQFQTDGLSADTKAGWARLIPDAFSPAPVGSGVFSYSSGSVLVSESGVPATGATTHARVYVDLSRNHSTGLAIANVRSTEAGITIKAFQYDGTTPIGTNPEPLLLAADGHHAGYADQLVPGLFPGFTGVLDISSETPFAALTLRSQNNERGDQLMTTFPVADATRPAPSPATFPQVADGGGYMTEFILISAGGEASTVLFFYDESGALTDFGE